MSFTIGDIVSPKPGYTGSGYRFIIIDEFLEPQINPMYKLKHINDNFNPVYGPIDEQIEKIKRAESVRWLDNELDFAFKISLPTIKSHSYQEHEPTPDEPEPINHVCIHHLGNKNLFDGGFVRTGIDTVSNCELRMSPIQEYYNSLCEKEKNEMKILDLYKDRKLDALNEEYADKRMEIKEKDEIQSVIAEMQKQVMTILENDGQEIHHDLGTFNLYTKETKNKLEQLESKYYEIKKEINREIEEIESLFEMTKDYDDRIKILKNYKVLNKDGKLNV